MTISGEEEVDRSKGLFGETEATRERVEYKHRTPYDRLPGNVSPGSTVGAVPAVVAQRYVRFSWDFNRFARAQETRNPKPILRFSIEIAVIKEPRGRCFVQRPRIPSLSRRSPQASRQDALYSIARSWTTNCRFLRS